MKNTKARNNPLELAVRSILFGHGLRFRVHYPIPDLRARTCDIAFSRQRVAIFIDGCFWHGCPQHGTMPKTNASFWSEKIERNKARDQETDRHLIDEGWLPLRFWEHEGAPLIARAILAVIAAP